MADNLTAPGAGAVLATDEVAGVHYPRTKLSFGADGSATDVSSDNPLPVEIIGAVSLDSSALTALETIDLGASSLAALENVTVGGTVELGLTSLAALESITATGPLTDTQLRATAIPVSGQFYQATQPISATALPLPAGAATQATVATLLTETTFTTRQPTTGPKAASGSVPMVLSNDQDPVFDHANAVKATVNTTSSTAITPPAGARYLRVHATADMFIRTDGNAAADAAGSILIKAGVPENIPCIGGTAVTAIVASGTAALYATPSKSR